MNTALIVLSIFYLAFTIVVLIITASEDGKFPIYSRNGNNFRYFTIGEMLQFVFFIPVFLLWKPFSNSGNFLKKRPFAKFQFKVGDKVSYNGKTGTVVGVKYEDGEELVKVPKVDWRDWFRTGEIKKLTPLEETLE